MFEGKNRIKQLIQVMYIDKSKKQNIDKISVIGWKKVREKNKIKNRKNQPQVENKNDRGVKININVNVCDTGALCLRVHKLTLESCEAPDSPFAESWYNVALGHVDIVVPPHRSFMTKNVTKKNPPHIKYAK